MSTSRTIEESPPGPPADEPEKSSAPPRAAIPAWLPFVAGSVAMLAVGSYRITAVSMDWDEGATISAAGRPVGQILGLAGHVDAVITPYYLFIHFWTRVFGSSDLALRAPSLIAMALGVGLVGELGRRLVGPAAGLVAGLICVTIPALSYYSAQARPYALAFAAATLSTLQLYRAVDRPSRGRWWGYAGCLLLTGVVHILAATVLAAHLIIVAIRWYERRDRALLRMLPACAATVVVLGPLVVLGSRQQQIQLAWVTPPTWRDVAAVPERVILSPQVAFLLGGLALVATVVLRRRTAAELAALAVVPVGLMLLASLAVPVWVPRYGTFALGSLAILAAATVTAPARPPVALRATVVLALIAFEALPAQIVTRQSHASPDSRGLADVIEARAVPGDGLVFGDFAWSLRPTVEHYLSRHAGTLPATAPRDLLLTGDAGRLRSLDARECADVTACLGTTGRIWLVTPLHPGHPLDKGTPKMVALRDRYTVAASWARDQGLVTLLVRRR
ncbi:MAG TPA: glycosyltransferase family 39 protein [Rugosimonospora sp.]